jgi:uncharacterized membrane protein YiaA
MYVGFLFKIIADHLSTQRGENIEEVTNTDGYLGTLKYTTLMVNLLHYIGLFNAVLSTSDSMSLNVCLMLRNNFERMSCVPALPGGTEEMHEKSNTG